MTSRSRSLKFNIVGDISDIKRSLSNVERSVQTTGQKMSNVGRLIQTGFAAVASGAVLQVVADLNKLGVEGDAIRNRFSTVFGDMSDDMAAWADDVNERFGTSVEQVQNMANEIQDILVPIGFAREEAAGLTQEVLETANALSEWTGEQITTADAAERVRKALLGERESLEALGVKVLQSDVNARLAAEGQSELTGEAKAQAEALATLNIITDKSTDALDAYASNANKALIQQKLLTAGIEDGRQAFGDFVANEVEALTEEAGILSLALRDVIDALNETGEATDDASENQSTLLETFLESAPVTRDLIGWYEDLRQKYLEIKSGSEDAAEGADTYVDAGGRMAATLQQQRDAGNEAAGGIDAATQAIKDNQEAIRAATDPVFALRQANDKLNEAFEKRVRLQAGGASASEINAALADELKAVQDLDFAQQNANDSLEPGIELIDRYGERMAIQTEALRLFKEEILGIDTAIRGLPSEVRLPTVSGNSSGIRNLEDELNRRGRGIIE